VRVGTSNALQADVRRVSAQKELTMVNTQEIKPSMPVVCSKNGQFAVVDHIDGNGIKLKRDDSGQHHYIPLNWVKTVDDKVHIDRPGDQAMREWSTSPIGKS
jgi:hypothetical protein